MNELSNKLESNLDNISMKKSKLKLNDNVIDKLLPKFGIARHKRIAIFLIFYYQTLTCWKS